MLTNKTVWQNTKMGVWLACGALILTACGQKGDLYLPKKSNQAIPTQAINDNASLADLNRQQQADIDNLSNSENRSDNNLENKADEISDENSQSY